MASAAIIGASALGAGASIYGSTNSANAASSAADDQSASQQQILANWQNAMPGLMQNISSAYGLGSNWLQAGTDQTYNSGNTAQTSIGTGIPAWNSALSTGTSALNNGIEAWNQALGNITSLNNPGVGTYDAGNTIEQQLLNNPSSVTQTPGYQFNLGQGLGAMERSGAAQGQYFSGAQGKALDEFGQNYATNTLGQWLGYGNNAIAAGQPSVNNTTQANIAAATGISGLDTGIANLNASTAAGLTGVGSNLGSAALTTGSQVAGLASQQAGLDTGESNTIAQLFSNYLSGSNAAIANSGNAQAQGTVNAASATNSGLSGAGTALTNGAGNYNMLNMYNSLLGNSQSAYPGVNTQAFNALNGNYTIPGNY